MGLGMVSMALSLLLISNVGTITDVDDQLRAVQITQFMRHGGWYDLTIRGIEMPEAYISPWSRLVDLPYIVISWLLQPFTSSDRAMETAFHVWPVVMLCLFCIIWLKTLQKLDVGGEVDRLIPVVASFILLMPTLLEFAPGRIDHHNVQLLLLAVAFLGVALRSLVGMAVCGVACVLSVLVGLELAPVVLVLAAFPCLAWMFGFDGARRQLMVFASTIALVAPVAGLIFVGPNRLWATECDAFSAPYLSLLVGYGAISTAAAWLIRSRSPAIRFASLVVPGAALLLWVGASHPLCLSGPYPMVDKVIWGIWISQIPQEQSFLQFFARGDWPALILIGIYALILVAACALVVESLRAGDSALATVYGVAIILLALYLLQMRFSRFPPVAISLVLPFVWERFRSGLQTDVPAIVVSMLMCLGGAGALAYAIPPRPSAPTLVDLFSYDACARQVKGLGEISPGRILLPPALGLALLDQLPSGVTVGALAFHRGGPGMSRFYDVFLSTDAEKRRGAAAPFTYLALCSPPQVLQFPANSLLAELQRGHEWPGLLPVLVDPETGFRLLRINHAELR